MPLVQLTLHPALINPLINPPFRNLTHQIHEIMEQGICLVPANAVWITKCYRSSTRQANLILTTCVDNIHWHIHWRTLLASLVLYLPLILHLCLEPRGISWIRLYLHCRHNTCLWHHARRCCPGPVKSASQLFDLLCHFPILSMKHFFFLFQLSYFVFEDFFFVF